jgi:hypothetical protein
LGADAKLTRPLMPLPLPAVGTPAASMNREVADAMLVLAMGVNSLPRVLNWSGADGERVRCTSKLPRVWC